jgi:hypothetical protein
MPFNLDKFRHAYDFTFPSSIGELKIGPLTISHEKELAKRFPRDGKADSTEYSRCLLSLMGGRPSETSKDPIPLADDEIVKLTTDDLDIFARLYIEKNKSWLFRDPEGDENKNSAETALVHLPQQEGEDIKAYLRRVRDAHLKRAAAYNRKVMERVLPKSLTSGTAANLFAQNRSILKSLEDQLSSAAKLQSAIRTFQQPVIPEWLRDFQQPGIAKGEAERIAEVLRSPEAEYRFKSADIRLPPPRPPNPIHKTNETLGLVVTQLESVAGVSARTAELVGNMNELGLGMVKSSAQHAERTAHQNKTMILVGVVAIVASAAFSIASYFKEGEREAATAVLLKHVAGQLEASQSAFAAAQRSADAQRSALQAELEAQRSALQAQIRAMARAQQRQQNKARGPK